MPVFMHRAAKCALGLVLASCLGLLAACGDGDSPAKAGPAATPTAAPVAKPTLKEPGLAATPANAAEVPPAPVAPEKITPEAIEAIFAAIPTQDQLDLEIAPLIDESSADQLLQKLEQELADAK